MYTWKRHCSCSVNSQLQKAPAEMRELQGGLTAFSERDHDWCMTDLICHPGWVMVPRYVSRHYSGCFCEGVFGWHYTWVLSKADCPPNVDETRPICWGPEQINRLTCAQQENSASRILDLNCDIVSSGSPVCQPALQILDLSASVINEPILKISLFIYLYTYNIICLFFLRTLTNRT